MSNNPIKATLADFVISALVKKGIMFEARNVDLDLPLESDELIDTYSRKLHIHCDHVSVKFDKD